MGWYLSFLALLRFCDLSYMCASKTISTSSSSNSNNNNNRSSNDRKKEKNKRINRKKEIPRMLAFGWKRWVDLPSSSSKVAGSPSLAVPRSTAFYQPGGQNYQRLGMIVLFARAYFFMLV